MSLLMFTWCDMFVYNKTTSWLLKLRFCTNSLSIWLIHCCNQVWFALCIWLYSTYQRWIFRSMRSHDAVTFSPLLACGWENRDDAAGAFLWEKRQSRVEIWRFLHVSIKSFQKLSSRNVICPLIIFISRWTSNSWTFSCFACDYAKCSSVLVSFWWWRFPSAAAVRVVPPGSWTTCRQSCLR